jgi:hypothetical protein
MKQTKGSKPSKLHNVLAAEFDRASAIFCMNWAIEDGEYKEAMLHQLEYLFASDEFIARYDALTTDQRVQYWNFKNAAKGVLRL